ncbi:MAG: TonB-dependent receptor [Bacteroidota bacterium]
MVSGKKFAVAVVATSILYSSGFAQQTNCNLSVSGTVICADDGKTLAFVAVGLLNTSKGVTTDEQGKFSISTICEGSYHLEASLIGYRKLDTLINVTADRIIKLFLKSDEVHLQEVHVDAQKIHKQEIETVTKTEISGAKLQETRGENLGDALKGIAGVDVIHSGPTIAKPVIHGLHSNRILILNNGVRQEGQQWGSEHAPEIDPFIATKLSVIKGAASIRYGADAIGGVVLVEPSELPKEKSLGGELNIVGMDNSRLYCGSGILQGALDKKLSGLSFRLQGTYRKAGNLHAPHYYLDNTGLSEKNYSGSVGYEREHYGVTVYYSKFNTDIGIYTGSHVGNPTELLQTFNGEKPVEDYGFSYTIKRGYQTVNHDLLKASAYLKNIGIGKLSATYARQKDVREEFDFHVPYTSSGVDLSNTPQVYFQLITSTAELLWEHQSWHHLTGSIGADFITQGNVFKGLGYRSLVPNFRNYGGGIFIIEKWIKEKVTLEAGVRYDYKWQREYKSNNNSLEVETPTQQYNNATGTLGAIYRISPKFSINANAGNAWRAPSVYELYVLGIHGNTSTFEIGDSNLKAEKAYNFSASLRYESNAIEIELGGYVNFIYNYIYLQPSPGDYVKNYVGAFPKFYFRQTDALYKGVDVDAKWHLTKHLQLEPKATMVFANDMRTHGYLILVPPQRFQLTAEYRWKSIGRLTDVFINAGGMYVPEQTRVPANSDFVPPPKSYSLLTAGIGLSIPVAKQKINISVQGDNLLNTAYRDYLNFFRYYANNPGRSFQLKIQIPFQIIRNKTKEN